MSPTTDRWSRRLGDIPVAVLPDGEDDRGEPRLGIVVVDASDADLSWPFFGDAVAELASRGRSARVVPAEHFVGVTAPPPAGFIFHVGRCGSTLFCRCLEETDTLLALREPEPLGALLDSPILSDRRTSLLVALISWYQAFASERAQRLVVKFPSVCSIGAAATCSLYPETPAVALFRHLEPVLGSFLEYPPPRDRPQDVASEPEPPNPNFAARREGSRWANNVEHLAALVSTGRATALSYRDLVERPTAAVELLIDDVPLTEEHRTAIAARCGLDAKRNGAQFQPRPPLDASMFNESTRHALDEFGTTGAKSLAAIGFELDRT